MRALTFIEMNPPYQNQIAYYSLLRSRSFSFRCLSLRFFSSHQRYITVRTGIKNQHIVIIIALIKQTCCSGVNTVIGETFRFACVPCGRLRLSVLWCSPVNVLKRFLFLADRSMRRRVLGPAGVEPPGAGWLSFLHPWEF